MTSTLNRPRTLDRPTRATTVRTVIYLRISSDDDLDRLGVQRQLEDCQRHADRLGWSVVAVLEDNDISASENSTKARPGYDAIVRMVLGDEVDVVLCWSFDRLYRRPAELEQFLPLIDRHSVRLVTVDGTEVSPGEGALVVRVRAAVAAEESRKVMMRVRRKMLANAMTGKKHGRTPYGWNDDGTAKAGEAEYVIELTERLLAGDSLHAIARDWNARNVPTQSTMSRRVRAADGTITHERIDRVWASDALRSMAARIGNAGLRDYTDAEGQPATAVGYWQALVSEDRYRAVLSLFNSRKRPTPTRKYLLSGLIGCGAPGCGGMLAGTRRSTGKRDADGTVQRMTVYRCMTCIRVSVPVDFVDAAVEQLTVERLSKGDIGELIGAASESAARAAADRVVALRARKTDAARAYGRELIDIEQLEEISAALAPELRMAEAAADRLTSGRTAALEGLTGEDAEARWAALVPDRKRAVLSLLWDITILPRDREHWTPGQRVIITEKAAPVENAGSLAT